jgi:transcriptional antiterminator
MKKKMKNKLFLNVDEVMNLLEVSKYKAYDIISKLNEELEEKGYLIIKGKIPTTYFMERFYKIGEVVTIPQEERMEWFHA